ncbi:uncharacterized protein [Primulina eburnea]|uniref:uncharacterized protein n=1 Tax=Primulina eburnea TaxID=1245227 RepID=UPI003C6CAD62
MRDGDRVRRAIYMLRDDASLWWEGTAHAVDFTILTWEKFKEMFYGKYFPADVRGLLTREFMSIHQGDSSVAEFIHKFDRGCHFVLIIARDVAQKQRNFFDGLRPTLRPDVMLMRPAGYDEAAACAFTRSRLCGIYTWKCRGSGIRLSPAPSHRRNKGHKGADCPKKTGPTTGRAYVMHAEEAKAEPDSALITGKFDSATVAGFQHILAMDWLLLNGVVIDFRQRSVSVRPPSEPVSQRLEDMNVVSEFSSVLPDDVSSIPPDRDVDFSIELMPGTVPISKLPYRLALAKMKDLKDQIQDLLDKGFIRPSFSPWVA